MEAETTGNETLDTVAATPTSPSAAPSSSGATTRPFFTRVDSTIATSPGQAMLNDEILRARAFGLVITVFAALTLVVVFIIGGHPVAQAMFATFLALYVIVSGWYTIKLYRDPSAYQPHFLILIAVLAVPTAYTGVYYWGFFSPAIIIVGTAIYFNSLVGSFLYTFICYLTMAGGEGVIAALILAGVLPDVGLIRAEAATLTNMVLTQVLVQAVLLGTFVIARMSRRATQDTMDQLNEAVRDIAQREALLIEARQELERANWAGGVGRFTDQVMGSYRLGAVLGRGAMGEVYEAVHQDTQEVAAVKMLQRTVLSDPNIVRRFAREAKAAAAIDSPNVVKVYEVGDEPLPYIAMERLEGLELAQLLREAPPSRRWIPDMVSQLARGLDAAHEAGVVHRDLKPQNVFRARDTSDRVVWKVLDFGVSKLADSSGTITQGSVVGTPAYMAPEQACGEDTDHRADIYGLGAIAYRVLAGRPPFTGKDTPSLLHAVVYDTPPPPSQVNPELNDRVDAVISRAMAKKRSDRFDSATELADALRDALAL